MDRTRRGKKKIIGGRVLTLLLCLAMLCGIFSGIAPALAMETSGAEITIELEAEELEQTVDDAAPVSEPESVSLPAAEQQTGDGNGAGTSVTTSVDNVTQVDNTVTAAGASEDQSEPATAKTEGEPAQLPQSNTTMQETAGKTGETQEETAVSKPEFTFSADLDGVKIHIHAADGILPEGTTAEVSKLSDGTLDTASQSIRNWATEKTLVQLIGFEISFFDADGTELHQFEQKIEITYSGLTFAENAEEMQVFHADADGNVTEALTEIMAVSSEVKFSSDQFSPILVAAYGSEEETDSVLTDQTVNAAVYADEAYREPYAEEVTITVTGRLPEGVAVRAYPVTVELEEETLTVVEAYNIGLFVTALDETTGETVEQEYEPESPVTVSIRSEALEALDSVSIYHIDNPDAETPNPQPELVTDDARVEDTEVTFNADRFSTYVVVADSNAWGGGQECDQSYYNADLVVYWDAATMTYTSNKVTGATINSDMRSHVTSVTLNTTDVAWADGSNVSSSSGGSALSTYYGDSTTTTNHGYADLVITPAAGYYVTAVVICCTSGGNTTPVQCQTFSEGNAFTDTFTFDGSGSVTIANLDSKWFCHRSNSGGGQGGGGWPGGSQTSSTNEYFILIEVAKIPTPLYVAYEYGNASTILGDDYAGSVFATDTGWIALAEDQDASKKNVYVYSTVVAGSGEQTEGYGHTLYQYAYDTTAEGESSTNWKHYANYITNEGSAAMAEKGYYFAGWEATYYSASLSGIVTDDVSRGADKTYSYTQATEYGTGQYGEGHEVALTTNVILRAIWKPIELKVTKVVSGLAETSFAGSSNTYTIQVQKWNETRNEWENYENALSFTISGDGSSTQTISPVVPGKYRAVETNGNEDLTDGTTIMYITVSDGGQVTYTTSSIVASQEITVTNNYSSQPATYDLTVKKTLSGNMYDANKEFTFTVTYGDKTDTFQLKKDETHTIEKIPVGAAVSVAEAPDGYTYSFVSITDGVSKTDVTNGISFTMPAQDVTVVLNNEKEVTIDTGVILDTLPYILILAVVIVCGFLFFRKRRNGRDD